MKILITGGNGQLGQEMQHLLNQRGITDYEAADVEKLDITGRSQCGSLFCRKQAGSGLPLCSLYCRG